MQTTCVAYNILFLEITRHMPIVQLITLPTNFVVLYGFQFLPYHASSQ